MAKKIVKEEISEGSIHVVAVREGYYGHKIRQEGEKFHIKSESELGSWMERLDGGENPAAEKKKLIAEAIGENAAINFPVIGEKVEEISGDKKEEKKVASTKATLASNKNKVKNKVESASDLI